MLSSSGGCVAAVERCSNTAQLRRISYTIKLATILCTAICAFPTANVSLLARLWAWSARIGSSLRSALRGPAIKLCKHNRPAAFPLKRHGIRTGPQRCRSVLKSKLCARLSATFPTKPACVLYSVIGNFKCSHATWVTLGAFSWTCTLRTAGAGCRARPAHGFPYTLTAQQDAAWLFLRLSGCPDTFVTHTHIHTTWHDRLSVATDKSYLLMLCQAPRTSVQPGPLVLTPLPFRPTPHAYGASPSLTTSK